MLRHTLTSLALFALLAATLAGCIPGYGYGMRPAYYGGGLGLVVLIVVLFLLFR